MGIIISGFLIIIIGAVYKAPPAKLVTRMLVKDLCGNIIGVIGNWKNDEKGLKVIIDLVTFASILRIPVSMHNLDNLKIFRSAAWNGFGTLDLEGTDYRACNNLGPLYKS